jgi:hypothetical protein
MKHLGPVFLPVLLLMLSLTSKAQTQPCATMNRLEALQQRDPSIRLKVQDAESAAQQWLADHPGNLRTSSDSDTVTIPVVFHVVYRTHLQRISSTQVLSQLDVLNQDFNGLNPDYALVPAAWDSTKADCGIHFCLAMQDPDGNPTTGITYDSTTQVSFDQNDQVKYTAQGGCDAWDPTRYLNIWICNLESPLLGYAQFPNAGPLNEDGVVLHYRATGTTGPLFPDYDKGRTGTHEVGHWLGLRHIWGDDGGSCQYDDFVADTPRQADFTTGCATFPLLDVCTPDSPGVMFMNYMNYSDDDCSYMFTEGQSQRMHGFLNSARSGLLTSPGCEPGVIGIGDQQELGVSIFPNPNNGSFELSFNSIANVDLAIFDALGSQIHHRNIYAQGRTTLGFDLSGFPSGIYFIRLSADGAATTKKILLK